MRNKLFKFNHYFSAATLFIEKFFELKKLKFLATGIINTIFSYAIFSLLIYAELQVGYALFFSTIAGVIFNYFSYKGAVFKKKANLGNFSKHVLTYIIIYCLNVAIVYLVINFITVNPYVAQLICIPILISVSWILMNKWVFK